MVKVAWFNLTKVPWRTHRTRCNNTKHQTLLDRGGTDAHAMFECVFTLKIWRRRRSCRTFLGVGEIALIPRIRITKATFGAGSTKKLPAFWAWRRARTKDFSLVRYSYKITTQTNPHRR